MHKFFIAIVAQHAVERSGVFEFAEHAPGFHQRMMSRPDLSLRLEPDVGTALFG